MLARLATAGRDAVGAARLLPDRVPVVYVTGGSSGMTTLRDAFARLFLYSRIALGDVFGSVVGGLGLDAGRHFGTRTPWKPGCEVLLGAAIEHVMARAAKVVVFRCAFPGPACAVHAGPIVERGGSSVGAKQGRRPLATGIRPSS
jgi:hypothetical protein